MRPTPSTYSRQTTQFKVVPYPVGSKFTVSTQATTVEGTLAARPPVSPYPIRPSRLRILNRHRPHNRHHLPPGYISSPNINASGDVAALAAQTLSHLAPPLLAPCTPSPQAFLVASLALRISSSHLPPPEGLRGSQFGCRLSISWLCSIERLWGDCFSSLGVLRRFFGVNCGVAGSVGSGVRVEG